MSEEANMMMPSSSDTEAKPHGSEDNGHGRPMMASDWLSGNMSSDDPDNPMNWSIFFKILTSCQAFLFAFTAAHGISIFTAGMVPFVAEFDLGVPPERFVAGMSLYLFGIAFAPYWVPHVTERTGRVPVYFATMTCALLFNLGAGLSHTIGGVLTCRFFAGFFGGPSLVLLEGTFADMWSARRTNTYYSVQAFAAFFGAGFGPLTGGYLVQSTGGWRWTQHFMAVLAAFTLFSGLAMQETYQREIPRRLARVKGRTRAQVIAEQDPPQSGSTFGEMFYCTVVQPAVMFFTQPVVTLTSLIMFFTYAVTFQWFIAVPAALEPAPPAGPGFSVSEVGLAFLVVPSSTLLGALSVVLIEHFAIAKFGKKLEHDHLSMMRSVEYRVLPAMFGIMLMTACLFWIGNTINPQTHPYVPIIGNGFFVWGASMVNSSIIPYLFDSFAPAGTLGAITAQAVGRILAAGWFPLVILFDLTALGPKWGLGALGFISLAFWPIPPLLFMFGTKWRRDSKYIQM